MKFSKYVRIVPYNENEVIVYNTINHSIIQLPSFFDQDTSLDQYIDQESLSLLDEMRFLEKSDSLIESDPEQYVINKDKLFISVELNLTCNLRCPYCYQLGKEKKGIISSKSLDDLYEYFKKVYDTEPYKDLYLKVLGGEPTLVWSKLMYLHKKTAAFCRERGIRYHLLIDTNGTMIDGIMELDNYDSLLLTIPLTYKPCHDSVRFDSHGKGTYDSIIENINSLVKNNKNIKIVIRYNVDADNIAHFGDFVKDIKEKLTFKPLISINYTAEMNDNDSFRTNLTYQEFVLWSSTDAIDLLIKEDMPVTVSPIISIEECQFRSKHSLKLFSNGTVGSCAMSFFDDERVPISDLIELFDETNEFWMKKNKQTLLAHPECLRCSDLFLCGGTSKLPCIMELDSKMCSEKRFGIVLDEFIRRYVDCQQIGKDDLFVVFKNGEGYR